ncbi:hypothetical protein WM31_00775 [Burkholderia ubonensis]|nr:hypothetical protein WM31_00775 [Burkholderia ubonensis]
MVMDASAMALLLSLDTLKWDSLIVVTGGGGFNSGRPSVTPYLWVVFFKIDGSSVTIQQTLQPDNSITYLSGAPVVIDTPSAHRDVGQDEIMPGGSRPIPQDIGSWIDQVTPIPVVDPALQSLLNEKAYPANFGFVAVALVDGGHIPDHAIAAGYAMLVQQVKKRLLTLLSKLGPGHTSITDDDINSVTAGIQDEVMGAIKDAMSFWEKLWAISGEDHMIGSFIGHWSRDEFATNGETKAIAISTPEGAYGVWSIAGSVQLTPPCPAEALQGLLDSFLQGTSSSAQARRGLWSQSLDAMHTFRNSGELRRYPGLALWWRAAVYHSPFVVKVIRQHEGAREAVSVVLDHVSSALSNPKRKLPDALVDAGVNLLRVLIENGPGLLRSDARRALAIFGDLKGSTMSEALKRFSDNATLSPPSPRKGKRTKR